MNDIDTSQRDLGPVDQTSRGNLGCKIRALRVTPLGWAHVSPEVRVRIALWQDCVNEQMEQVP